MLYFYLLKGIDIQNLHFQNINVGKLYIKIDKKIILKTENISIHTKKDNKKEINFNKTHKMIKKIIQYLNFFQEIEIKNLVIDKNSINLIELKNNRFTINTEEINLIASIEPQATKYTNFKIYNLNLKKPKIVLKNIEGKIYSDLLKLHINLNLTYDNAHLNLNLDIGNNSLKYYGALHHITPLILERFKDKLSKIKLNRFEIYSVSFKGNDKVVNFNLNRVDTKIDNISIKIPISNGIYLLKKQKLKINLPKIVVYKDGDKILLFNNLLNYNLKRVDFNIGLINIKKFSYNLFLTNLKLDYYQNILKVFIPNFMIQNKDLHSNIYNINLTYNLQTKYLSSKIPTAIINYKNIKNIKISNIFTIFHNNLLTNNIAQIKINNLRIDKIKISLKDNIVKTTLKTDAILSKWLINILSTFNIKIPIYQKYGKNDIVAKIDYNLNNKKIDTDLKVEIKKSGLMLNNSPFLYIEKAHLDIKNNKIFIKNSDVEYNKSILNLNYKIDNGIVDLDNHFLKMKGIFEELNLKDIIQINNYPENLYIDLKTLNIILKNLDIKIAIHKNIDVVVGKLSKFKPYIQQLTEYGVNQGTINVNIGDKIVIDSNISDINQTILEQNLTAIKKLNIKTIIEGDNTTIYNKNLKLTITKEKNLTTIKGGYKNLDINLTQFIDKNKTEQNVSEKNITTPTPNLDIDIKAKNSFIHYKNNRLFSEKLKIEYNQTNKFINSLYKDRNITIIDKNGVLKVYGLNIKDKTFKELTNTNILNNPLITFFALKTKDSEVFQGFIKIKKGYIKELKAFNNILAFINLIPSLVTFQAVGFSNKGYKIKNGFIEYIYHKDILYLKNILIKGENLSFDGNGYIDLKKQIIKMNVNVNLIVKLLKDIPIVNYILLGKDGGITLKLTIDGSLKDPKVHSNTTSNIIQAPIGIIKRVLLTPFRPFMNDK